MTIKFSVKLKSDTKRLKKVQRFFNRLDESIEVGFFGGKPHPKNNGKFTIAEVAVINEFGPRTQGPYSPGDDAPPSRPFFFNSIRENRNWEADLRVAVTKMFSGKGTPKQVMRELGQKIADDVRDTIEEGDFTPNSPKTIARKGGDKPPLTESGTMAKNVSFRLTKKKKR